MILLSTPLNTLLSHFVFMSRVISNNTYKIEQVQVLRYHSQGVVATTILVVLARERYYSSTSRVVVVSSLVDLYWSTTS